MEIVLFGEEVSLWVCLMQKFPSSPLEGLQLRVPLIGGSGLLGLEGSPSCLHVPSRDRRTFYIRGGGLDKITCDTVLLNQQTDFCTIFGEDISEA